MYRVLIADTLPMELVTRFGDSGVLQIDDRMGISTEDLEAEIEQYDGLVVRSRTRVDARLLQQCRRLKVVGRAGAGVDNIDIGEATRRGIIVMNTPGGNTIAAAEHTIGLILAALRNIPRANAALQANRWERKTNMGNELYSRTVGIIGLGKIGREVARRLQAFGATLLGYDPILTSDAANRLGVRLVTFDELMGQSDIITVHVPSIPETVSMINASNLALCREGVMVVNCARGGIINEEDLLAALNSGKVGIAALDVFRSEPPDDWTLATHPRVVATPHLGASTEEAQAKVAAQILEQIAAYFSSNVARNAVNFVSVDEKIQPIISPYFELADRLGSMFSRLRHGRIRQASLQFYGDVAQLPREPIASHLMAGALKSYRGTGAPGDVDFINAVNALAVAREKGIDIEIVTRDHPLTGRTNLVAAEFSTESGSIRLAATLYAREIFRLVEFGKYDVDADLGGRLVIVVNDDVPGIIGLVGMLLGARNINISHVSSGRDLKDRSAVNIFNVEGPLDEKLYEELAGSNHIREVHFVDLNRDRD